MCEIAAEDLKIFNFFILFSLNRAAKKKWHYAAFLRIRKNLKSNRLFLFGFNLFVVAVAEQLVE